MKHDSDTLKRVKAYFMRRKSAAEAYAFERECERDAFLYEAVEGFEEMLSSEIQQAMDELDDHLEAKSRGGITVVNWRVAGITASMVAVVGALALLASLVLSKGENIDPTTGTETQPKLPSSAAWVASEKTKAIAQDTATSVNTLPFEINQPQEIVAEPKPPQPAPVAQPKQEPIKTETTQEATSTQKVKSETNEVVEVEPQPEAQEVESLTTEATGSEKTENAPATTTQPKPKGGMTGYRGYLKNNLKVSDGMPSGAVVVTFEIDRSGKPKKLAVAQSLCTACDAEAMRLVQEGPAWDAQGKKERVSVTVQFP